MASQRSNQPDDDENPLSFWEVVGEEYWDSEPTPPEGDSEYAKYCELRKEHADAWRALQKLRASATAQNEGDRGAFGAATKRCEEATAAFSKHVCHLLHAKPRSALCFSGGGIRSATFGLGVLQGLAKHSWQIDKSGAAEGPSLLSEFDYLSTVSGGGYLGSWFSAWARREQEAPAVTEQKNLHQPGSEAQQQAGNGGVKGVEQVIKELVSMPETGPVTHLRKYSNYLTPQLGLLSGDTWTWVATILRNMFLNWLVLFPLLAAVLLAPQLYKDLMSLTHVPVWLGWCLGVVGVVAGAVAYAYLIVELPSAGNCNDSQGSFLVWCAGSLSLCVFCLSLGGYWLLGGKWQLHVAPSGAVNSGMLAFTIFVFGLLAIGIMASVLVAFRRLLSQQSWQLVAWKERLKDQLAIQKTWIRRAFVPMVGTTALAGALIDWLLRWLHGITNAHRDDLYAVFAFPVVMAIIIITQALLVGLVSQITTDEDREWWGRAGGWLWILTLTWAIASVLVLFAPQLLGGAGLAGRWLIAAILSSLSLGGVASALGFSSNNKTVDVKIPFSKLSKSEMARKIALPIVLLLFLLLLVPSIASVNSVLHSLTKVGFGLPNSDARFDLLLDLLLMVVFSAISLGMAYLININKFSLHGMYRARLIRAYLGASNTKRSPNWFTGFDPDDNLAMHTLLRKPLHVVNMALNLVKGGELAWQERKAESFTVSAMHTGNMRVGYQRSQNYGRPGGKNGDPGGITLGGAVAISGAAASPNMGYHSSPLLTVVMTLFNARLGAWLANPGEPGRGVWPKESPTPALRSFCDEAFGLTTDTNKWVYLSDGGHFENLGLYEMVMRRCHYILAIDASADPDYQYQDLTNAIRKIRVDLGIPIDFPQGLNFSPEGEPKGKHFAVGQIHYSQVDPGAKAGVLVYVKPSLNANEPQDVQDYHDRHQPFPQQPTTDQWFDESQFESYRCLGEHIIDEMLGEEPHAPSVYTLQRFFNKVASPPNVLVSALRAVTGS